MSPYAESSSNDIPSCPMENLAMRLFALFVKVEWNIKPNNIDKSSIFVVFVRFDFGVICWKSQNVLLYSAQRS